MTQHYDLDDEQRFVIEQYNDTPAFASFLPGIAGTTGRPAWAFYVNRGQAIASFGVHNKDGAFLEFFPADKAYQLTAARGFRTFLKISTPTATLMHEPFQRDTDQTVKQRLYITPHEVSVEEINPTLGCNIRADMFTLPEAPVAGLVRRVTLTNTSTQACNIEIIDGLPQVLPYAMNQWILKFMSRTAEAFMQVEAADTNLPFYRLKVWPTDSPQVETVTAGNFFVGIHNGQRTQTLVDAEKVFGLASDFSQPERFFGTNPFDCTQQVMGNQTPAAFQNLKLTLQPGASQTFYGLYGNAASLETLQQFIPATAQKDYFEQKRAQNQQLIQAITQRGFTLTSQPLFDAHARQAFLDNGLRGGFPHKLSGGVYVYLFGRKHGDLERDYNDFLLQDTPYSEGNGDFRDVLQNRRMDLHFEPQLGAKNIHYFFSLIQPDGYNPCALRNSQFSLTTTHTCAQYYAEFPGLEALLQRGFKYAELWQLLVTHTSNPEPILETILAQAQELEDAEFDRGYWSDHWTYLVDLLLSYQAIYPEQLAALFLEKRYTFFDPSHWVKTRATKYVLTTNGLRQYNAVQERPEKHALLAARQQRRYQVRNQAGQGEVVYTTLLGKILTLIANKLATLDPFGVGIEMEADRPGWCDALNGLPGILGSSVNETIELKRLVDFSAEVLTQLDGNCTLPAELATFVSGLEALLQRPTLTPELFWRESGAQKEAYRKIVFMGFDGAERSLSISSLQKFLQLITRFLDSAIDRARTPEGILTYFSYDVEYPESAEERFVQTPLPLFLEGFVHALRIAPPAEAHRLYTAARNSPLFDAQLGMYRLNAPLGDNALQLGRIGVFNYGWLENGSIFLHMHYKFVLEMVRAGLISEFYQHMHTLLVAFRDPQQYGRNPSESSSFLVSSGFTIDPRQHGRGCVARLSGATVEFLNLWIYLFLGPTPFVVEEEQLRFKPSPLLANSLFLQHAQTLQLDDNDETIPAHSAACSVLGKTLLVYVNPAQQDTFGDNALTPSHYRLYARDGSNYSIEGRYLEAQDAQALRDGQFRRVDITLA